MKKSNPRKQIVIECFTLFFNGLGWFVYFGVILLVGWYALNIADYKFTNKFLFRMLLAMAILGIMLVIQTLVVIACKKDVSKALDNLQGKKVKHK